MNHRVVSQAVVIATGVRADGWREVLGFAVGDSEDGAVHPSHLLTNCGTRVKSPLGRMPARPDSLLNRLPDVIGEAGEDRGEPGRVGELRDVPGRQPLNVVGARRHGREGGARTSRVRRRARSGGTAPPRGACQHAQSRAPSDAPARPRRRGAAAALRSGLAPRIRAPASAARAKGSTALAHILDGGVAHPPSDVLDE